MENNKPLTQFQSSKILSNDLKSKVLVLLDDNNFSNPIQNNDKNTGKFDGDTEHEAILVISKKPFSESSIPESLAQVQKQEEYFHNDIFRRFNVLMTEYSEWNQLDIQTIYPATQKLIAKYSKNKQLAVTETPAIYENVVSKHIDAVQSISLQWLYNILDGKAEQESILLRDSSENGFVLLPDFKFTDQTQKQTLHLIAMPLRRDLKSIRDLNGSHIPFLQHIRDTAIELIESTIGVSRDELRVFFHYQPTYYHLHVHFTHIAVSDESTSCDRAHLLLNVIQNLSLDSNYYKNATLFYTLPDNSSLLQNIQEYKQQSSKPQNN